MKHSEGSHLISMTIIMILSGLLSTMNIWTDSWDDIRFSLNDIYMVSLMTGWMLFFMGVYYRQVITLSIGVVLVILSFFAIRTQAFISERQYLLGMIPHHSMAVMMSKRLEEKPNSIQTLLASIIKSQEEEIQFMKSRLA